MFCKRDISLVPLKWEADRLEYFLPCKVNDKFNLLAVWTRDANSPTFRYIGQLWKYLQKHKERLAIGDSVVCGDLNSNACWDVWDRWWNHSDVIRELGQIGLASLYHQQTGEEQGKELQPTFYMYRKQERPYHIDYAFLSDAMRASSSISVGKPDEWLEFSDHMPVGFTIAG